MNFRLGPLEPMWVISLLTARVRALSPEIMRTGVAADSGGVPVDPTDLVVRFAFLGTGRDPVEADWNTGEWDTTLIGTYVAQIAPCAAPVSLPAGEYYAWIELATLSAPVLVKPFATLLVE